MILICLRAFSSYWRLPIWRWCGRYFLIVDGHCLFNRFYMHALSHSFQIPRQHPPQITFTQEPCSRFGQVLAFIPLVIEAVTTIYLVRRLPEPQEQRSKHQRTTIWCVEGAFVVAVAILISIGNFRWPTASFVSRPGKGHGEQDAQVAQKNEPESEKIRDADGLT